MLAAPVAVADLLVAAQDQLQNVQYVVANDSDPDGDTLVISGTTQPQHGTLSTVGGELIYTPNTGFAGDDSFQYTVTDPGGATSTADVMVSVNASVNVAAARDQILANVTGDLSNPTQPGKQLAYGPTAFSVANLAGQNSLNSMVAASTLGQGRVISMNDHQWLNLSSYGGNASMKALYENSIDWLGQQVSGSAGSKTIKVVTLNNSLNAQWLTDQGYANVVNATWSTLATELTNTTVFVAGWMGTNVSAQNLQFVSSYVKSGGGVLVSDYAPGYNWWWNTPVPQSPGNVLLRDAGIFLLPDIEWSSAPIPVDRATDQVSGLDILDIIDGTTNPDDATKTIAYKTFAKLLANLPADDSLRSELIARFGAFRFGEVQATPISPVTDAIDKAQLTAEADWLKALPLDEMPAHPTAAEVYGDVLAGATTTNQQTFTVDVSKTGWLVTGVSALPGQLLTIEVPNSLVGQGYSFRVNGHVDNISGRSSWDRLPYGISSSFSIDSSVIQIASSFGGTIYLDVGGQAAGIAPTVGMVDLVVTGAIETPIFVLGETTNQQWATINGQKPAPYAELVSDRVSMSLPASWVRDLDNVHEIMTYWDDAAARQEWVGATEALRTNADRFNVDVQISVGLLHAGYPIQGPTWASEELVDLEYLKANGNWGYFHELGHERQRNSRLGHGYNSAWTFDGDTEVTVNIFANAALELSAPNSPTGGWGYSVYPDLVMQRSVTTVSDASKPSFENKDPYPFYFQLADGPWGWQGYRDVLATYVDDYLNTTAELPGDNQAEKNEWLLRWSQQSGFDMTQYMVDNWKLEVDAVKLAQVAALNLPNWMPLAIDSDIARSSTPANSPITLDLGSAGRGLDSVAILAAVGAVASGTFTDDGNGIYTYTPNNGFAGTDTLDVTYQSSAGNQQVFQVVIEVAIHGVLEETFLAISGSTINDLRNGANFPNAPDRVEFATDFETPSNQADSYGVRTRAFLTAPVSGSYTFWIASDDAGELWLSTDTNVENASLIANVSSWASSRQWDKFASQKSVVVELVGGQSYYIEALMKEGGGGDNLAIAWASPELGISEPTVIANQYLRIFGADVESPDGVNSAVTINEGELKTLTLAELSSNDLDSQSYQLVYTFDSIPTNGELLVDGVAAVVGSTFTQRDILDGDITLQHDGSNTTADQILFTVQDPIGNESTSQTFAITVVPVRDATVVGQHIFYEGSSFDGSSDRDSIAPDKSPLLHGETATYQNISNYWKGITGLVVDVSSVAGTPMVSDFEFRVGNDDDPANWPLLATAAQLEFAAGAGAGGSDELKLIWPDNTIEKTWLQVKLLANENTDLVADSVFYFGNAIGETGNDPTNARVDLEDVGLTRTNQSGFSTVGIESKYDFNRDRRVDLEDLGIARVNQSGFTPLNLITPSDGSNRSGFASKAGGGDDGSGVSDVADGFGAANGLSTAPNLSSPSGSDSLSNFSLPAISNALANSITVLGSSTATSLVVSPDAIGEHMSDGASNRPSSEAEPITIEATKTAVQTFQILTVATIGVSDSLEDLGSGEDIVLFGSSRTSSRMWMELSPGNENKSDATERWNSEERPNTENLPRLQGALVGEFSDPGRDQAFEVFDFQLKEKQLADLDSRPELQHWDSLKPVLLSKLAPIVKSK